jgi:hypothetical protein
MRISIIVSLLLAFAIASPAVELVPAPAATPEPEKESIMKPDIRVNECPPLFTELPPHTNVFGADWPLFRIS